MKAKTGFKIALTVLLGLVIAGSCLLFGCTAADETHFLRSGDIAEISLYDSDITLVMNSGTRRLRYGVKTSASDESYIGYNEATVVGLEWRSLDEGVATVRDGIVTPTGVGDTTIFCYIRGTDVFDTCEVRVESDEVLRVGIKDDVPGFSYHNPNTWDYEGLEVELGAMIAYDLRMQVEYVPLKADERVGALNKGYDEYVAKLQEAEERAAAEAEAEAEEEEEEEESESEPGILPLAEGDEEDLEEDEDEDLYDGYKGDGVDVVIATYSVTTERMNEVHFSSVYYDDYVRILSENTFQNKVDATDLKGVFEYFYDLNAEKEEGEELETLKVAVVEGTTAGASFQSYASGLYDSRDVEEEGDEGKEIVDKTMYDGQSLYEVVEYEEYLDCENAIAAGEADLFCGDGSILAGYTDEKYMSFLDDYFEVQHYAAATSKTSYYSDIVDYYIDLWIGDGTMNALYEKYGIVVIETEEEEA